jgi:hypothetical protein
MHTALSSFARVDHSIRFAGLPSIQQGPIAHDAIWQRAYAGKVNVRSGCGSDFRSFDDPCWIVHRQAVLYHPEYDWDWHYEELHCAPTVRHNIFRRSGMFTAKIGWPRVILKVGKSDVCEFGARRSMSGGLIDFPTITSLPIHSRNTMNNGKSLGCI